MPSGASLGISLVLISYPYSLDKCEDNLLNSSMYLVESVLLILERISPKILFNISSSEFFDLLETVSILLIISSPLAKTGELIAKEAPSAAVAIPFFQSTSSLVNSVYDLIVFMYYY